MFLLVFLLSPFDMYAYPLFSWILQNPTKTFLFMYLYVLLFYNSINVSTTLLVFITVLYKTIKFKNYHVYNEIYN